MTLGTFGFLFTGILLNAAAQLLLKAGVRNLGELSLSLDTLVSTTIAVGTQIPIIGGLFCYGISVFVWIIGLSRVDVTIAYPGGRPSMIDLMADRVPAVRVHVRLLPIPAELAAGNYQDDRAFRARFQQWMNGLWQQKDADLERMLAARGDPG